MAIKKFFRKVLQYGNEFIKTKTVMEIKDYYDNNDFSMEDIVKISKGTSKEEELFDYVDVPNYLKTTEKNYNKDNGKTDNFDMFR